MTSFRLLGVSEFKTALAGTIIKQHAATRAAVAEAAHLIEREAKQQLSQTSHERGTPTPSQPGDPPSLVSGNLRRSISVEGPFASGPIGWAAMVGPTAVYGRIQELGGWTGHSSYLPPRPYMRPAWDAVKPRLRSIFYQAWGLGPRL